MVWAYAITVMYLSVHTWTKCFFSASIQRIWIGSDFGILPFSPETPHPGAEHSARHSEIPGHIPAVWRLPFQHENLLKNMLLCLDWSFIGMQGGGGGCVVVVIDSFRLIHSPAGVSLCDQSHVSICLFTLGQNASSRPVSNGFEWKLDPMILGWWGIWGVQEFEVKGHLGVNRGQYMCKSTKYFSSYQMQWLFFIVDHRNPLPLGHMGCSGI